MLIFYIIWTCCTSSNILIYFFYCLLTKKGRFSFNIWNWFDVILMVCSFSLLFDTENLFGEKDDNGNVIPSDGKSDLPFVVRASVLSINDILVWIRVAGVLVAYEEFGPLLRTIFLLTIISFKYLLIYLIIMIAFATVFTTIFYKNLSLIKPLLFIVVIQLLLQHYSKAI